MQPCVICGQNVCPASGVEPLRRYGAAQHACIAMQISGFEGGSRLRPRAQRPRRFNSDGPTAMMMENAAASSAWPAAVQIRMGGATGGVGARAMAGATARAAQLLRPPGGDDGGSQAAASASAATVQIAMGGATGGVGARAMAGATARATHPLLS